jgi:hypothetical protein
MDKAWDKSSLQGKINAIRRKSTKSRTFLVGLAPAGLFLFGSPHRKIEIASSTGPR